MTHSIYSQSSLQHVEIHFALNKKILSLIYFYQIQGLYIEIQHKNLVGGLSHS